MHRLERRDVLLFAQDRLDAFGVVAAHEPSGLVAHEVVLVLPENPYVPLRGCVARLRPARQGNVVLSGTIGCDVFAVVPGGSGPLPAGTKLKGFLL